MSEPTYPSAEELMGQLGSERIDFMRSMMGDIKYKPGTMEEEENPYRSPLESKEQRGRFEKWLKDNNVPFHDSPTSDYDMQGFFKAMERGDPNTKTAVSQFDGKMHFPDTWKTPYHKTFSDQSIYAEDVVDPPHWEGDKLIDKNGRVIADETPPPRTERFWKQQLLHESMPESPNAPIQDYVNPPPDFGGSSDTMPNTYEGVPGFEPDKRGLSPARNSPKVPGTLDAPNIRFPEDPQTRT